MACPPKQVIQLVHVQPDNHTVIPFVGMLKQKGRHTTSQSNYQCLQYHSGSFPLVQGLVILISGQLVQMVNR